MTLENDDFDDGSRRLKLERACRFLRENGELDLAAAVESAKQDL